MTTEQAKMIVHLLMKADNGCSDCVSDLIQHFLDDFPGFYKAEVISWIAEKNSIMAELVKRKVA